MTAFDRAVSIVLPIEGEHSDRPAGEDPGGDTWFGLTRRWNADMPWPPTREQAIERYRMRYWDAIQGDLLPWPVSLVTFDAAVQHAPVDAIRFLQRALRIEPDGALGPKTRAELRACNPQAIADEILARRAVYYPSLPNWEANKLGWMRRLVTIHREAMRG